MAEQYKRMHHRRPLIGAPCRRTCAAPPSSSSMRSSWLYFATRSVRLAEPVLIWPGAGGDGEIGDGRVFGLAGAVRDDDAVAGLLRHQHRVERLGDGADLIQLDQDRVGDALVDALLQDRGVGDEQVVADELHLVADRARSASSSPPSRSRRCRPRSRRSGSCRSSPDKARPSVRAFASARPTS